MPDDTAYLIVASHPTYKPVLDCFRENNILTDNELKEAITEGLNRNKKYWDDSARKSDFSVIHEDYIENSREIEESLSLLEQSLDIYIDSLD
ncbi:MAG: hypothetical protein KAS90_06095 [Candidatus Aenigmarchaeota archaeon]|nr:hypothetical protein [Candidatus Aenigmarchaeota archaeon]